MIEQHMNTVELAERLRRKPETMRRWARAKKIPYTKDPSGDLLFSPKAIERWLALHTVPGR